MHVAELSYPGGWLDYDDNDWAGGMRILLFSLESCLTEAAVSLNLFEPELKALSAFNTPMISDWEIKRRENLTKEFKKTLGQADFYRNYPEIMERVDMTITREKWAAGEMPKAYKNKLAYLHAASFVHALDISGKLLTVMNKDPDAPEEVGTQMTKFYSQFPELVGVRDTVEHIEDRVRGLDRNHKPLELLGQGLTLSSLRENWFGCTMSNGEYGEVHISLQSLSFLTECIQKVINSFQWRGSTNYYPR